MKALVRKIILSFLRSFKSYRTKYHLPKREISYDELNPAVDHLYFKEYNHIERTPPLFSGNSIHPKFKDRLTETPPKTFVVTAKEWHVWGNQGTVITNDGYLFKDVSREFDNPVHSVFNQFKLIPAKRVSGRTAVLAASGGITYYHWLFDILARINILEKAVSLDIIDHFVVNYTGLPFQHQTLGRAGIDLSKVIESNDNWNFHIQADELVIPSLPSGNDSPSYEACLYLRGLYNDEINEDGPARKLYIKRPPGRSIVNEDELLQLLIPLGFEIIYPYQLTVAEQAKAFSKAEMVIGIHGADFANLVFCKPGTRVMDIFSSQWINPCYWILSNHMNLKYSYLIGESSYKDKNRSAKGANVWVDVAKFKTLLYELCA